MKTALFLAAVPLVFFLNPGQVHGQTSVGEISGTISTANTVNQSQQGGATAARAQQQARQQANQLNAQQQEPPGYDRDFAARYGDAAARNQARSYQPPQAVQPVTGGQTMQPGVAGVPLAARPLVVAPKQPDPEQEERIINFQRQNAISGNPSAQYDLGMRYLKGDGVEQDDGQALNWLSLAAKNGNSRAKKKVEELQKKITAQGKETAVEPAASEPVKDAGTKAK